MVSQTTMYLPPAAQKSRKRKKRAKRGRDRKRHFSGQTERVSFKSKCLIIGDLQWHFIELANQKGVVYDKRFITLSPAT